jgi:ribosome-associated protein
LTENPHQEEKSRSQVKRDFRALKELAMQLAGLPKGQLRVMPLSEKALEATLASHGMARNALHRHYRYLSALLAQEDVAAIRAALGGARRPHVTDVAKLHETEQWRDELLTADETHLAALFARYPECDRDHVRRLVRSAREEQELEKPPKSARQLFRYLRQLQDGVD